MEVRSCKNCGRLYNFMGGEPICDQCRRDLEDKFQQVKRYISENVHASVAQTAEDNDVSVKQIKKWIKEERLVLSEAGADGIVCEHCGQPIRSGRFCDKCKNAMADSFSGSIAKPKIIAREQKSSTGNKIRFLQ